MLCCRSRGRRWSFRRGQRAQKVLGQQNRQQCEQPGEKLMQGKQEVGNAHGGTRPVWSAGENSRRFAGLGGGRDGTRDGATKRAIRVLESAGRGGQDPLKRRIRPQAAASKRQQSGVRTVKKTNRPPESSPMRGTHKAV